MAVNEEQLLRHFQASGSREALRELLKAHQDRIYNACFQVLGRAEDAEDAAQAALLKLAEGARSARDADAFRGWIYRVSLRAAIDLWRRREATRTRETRAVMNRPAAPPLDDRERVALFEAMDGLDDRERSLLLEHYFEKVPLADLGERRGISAVAIWKRIDKAREKLKKLLLTAGFVAASARVGEALEETVPATAPSTLVGEAILGKFLAGGLAVGVTKSSILPLIVIAVVLLFGISTVGYVVLRSPETQVRANSKRAMDTKAGDAPNPAPAMAKPTKSAGVPKLPGNSQGQEELRQRFESYRTWHSEWKALLASLESSRDRKERDRLVVAKLEEGRKLLEGSRELISEDPSMFLEFIQIPANEGLLETLIGHALYKTRVIEGRHIFERQAYAELSPALMVGMIEIAKTGTSELRRTILGFLSTFEDVPAEFDAAYAILIHDPGPQVQEMAIEAIGRNKPLPPAYLEEVKTVFETTDNYRVKQVALEAVSRTQSQETLAWLLAQLRSSGHTYIVGPLARNAATALALPSSSNDEGLHALVGNALKVAAQVRTDHMSYYWLILAALHLPADRAVPVLETAIPHAPTPKLGAAAGRALEKLKVDRVTSSTLRGEFQNEALKD